MSYSFTRSTLAAAALIAGLGVSSAAQADTCGISFSVLKAGWVIGGSGGSGVMRCPGRNYPISIGGISAGFVFGASETRFNGRATFHGSPYNVAGVYGAGGAGAAVGVGRSVCRSTPISAGSRYRGGSSHARGLSGREAETPSALAMSAVAPRHPAGYPRGGCRNRHRRRRG